MLERFREIPTPEEPVKHLIHTLVVLGNTQGVNPQDAVLDHPTRIATLAAGLLVTAGLAKMIAVFSASPNGTNLVKKYLNDIDVSALSISNKKIDDKINEAMQLRKFIKEHETSDVGIITTHGSENKVKEDLEKVGLVLKPVSLEEEVGERIAKSAKNSHHIITEILKESLLSLVRFQKMLDEVKISRISLS
jgi:hypothetical protein